MATAKKSTMTVVRASGATKKLADRGVQTNPEPPVVRNKVGRPRKHPYPILNGTPQQVGSRSSESLNTATSLTISTVRRRRASQQIAPEASTRELRSRSKNTNFDTSLTSISSRVRSSSLSTKCEFHLGADQSSLKQGGDFGKESGPILDGSVSNLPTSQSKARLINIKLEDVDHSPLLMSETFLDPLIASSSAPAKTPRPIRTPRQIKQKDIDVSRKDTKEKWGRKRKARDDESPGGDAENGFEPLLRDSTKKGKEEKGGGEKERETKKPIRTPVRPTQFNMATPAASPATASLPTTPSLKIRLPPTRLQHFKYAATLPSAHSDTSTPR